MTLIHLVGGSRGRGGGGGVLKSKEQKVGNNLAGVNKFVDQYFELILLFF